MEGEGNIRHGSNVNPVHPSQTQRRMGHPQRLRLNFGVIYPGYHLPAAPSIVGATEIDRRGWATRLNGRRLTITRI